MYKHQFNLVNLINWTTSKTRRCITRLYLFKKKMSSLVGIFQFPVTFSSTVKVRKVGEFLPLPNREATHGQNWDLFPKTRRGGTGGLVLRNFPSVFVQPRQRENGRCALIFMRAYPGLWLATWKKEVTKSPLILPFRAHAGGNGRLVQRYEEKSFGKWREQKKRL